MKVVITGGGGFLGQVLARRLLAAGELTGASNALEPIDEMVLFDSKVPPKMLSGLDRRAEVVTGDVADAGRLREVVDRDDISVFHLASMVSSECETNFDAALAVNLDGCRTVLEACRARASRPRLVFTSSIAAFGGLAASEVAHGSPRSSSARDGPMPPPLLGSAGSSESGSTAKNAGSRSTPGRVSRSRATGPSSRT
jgi:nucleoside-diphosphate-sugar epimerase